MRVVRAQGDKFLSFMELHLQPYLVFAGVSWEIGSCFLFVQFTAQVRAQKLKMRVRRFCKLIQTKLRKSYEKEQCEKP